MPQASRFALISRASPTLVDIASIYFMVGGGMMALVTILPPLFMPEVRDRMTGAELTISVVLSLVLAAGIFWTGVLLSRNSRRGAYCALGYVAISLLTSFDLYSVVFATLSVVVLSLVWRDLH